jgi:hypothetical protein
LNFAKSSQCWRTTASRLWEGEGAVEWCSSITHRHSLAAVVIHITASQASRSCSTAGNITQPNTQYSYEISAFKNTLKQALQNFRVPSMLLVCHIVVERIHYVPKLSSDLISRSSKQTVTQMGRRNHVVVEVRQWVGYKKGKVPVHTIKAHTGCR